MKAAHRYASAIAMSVIGTILGSCSMPWDIFAEHEKLCRREARVIVHDPELWTEYLKEAEETYRSRSARFPETGRVVVEYAPSFEIKFGPELRDRRISEDGSVIRDDLYIVKYGKIVAQYIDFVARRDSLDGAVSQSCIGNFPEIYDLRKSAQ